MDSFESLIPKFVELNTKFGKLLLHYDQTLSANHVLLFSEHCVNKSVIHLGMEEGEQCLHPHYGHYGAMLQVLESVYERIGEVQQALKLRMRRYSYVSSHGTVMALPRRYIPCQRMSVLMKLFIKTNK